MPQSFLPSKAQPMVWEWNFGKIPLGLGMENWENCLKTVVIFVIVLGDNSCKNKTLTSSITLVNPNE